MASNWPTKPVSVGGAESRGAGARPSPAAAADAAAAASSATDREPRFEVMMMIELVKFTVRPLASVIQ